MPQDLAELDCAPVLNKKIKAVFFDIDGTLLGEDGHYTEATQREILRIKELGVKTSVASGRPAFAAKFIINELKIDDPGVFCTGAHVYSPLEKRTIQLSSIPEPIASNLYSDIKTLGFHYEAYTESTYYYEEKVNDEIFSIHTELMRQDPEKHDFTSIIGEQKIVKFLVAIDSHDKQVQLVELEKKFPELRFAYAGIASHPEWVFASIISSEVNKKTVFKNMTEYFGITADEVMAIGDSHSDMDFIESAGVGVAMGNANDAVKACANYVTKSVSDEGVAYALSQLVV